MEAEEARAEIVKTQERIAGILRGLQTTTGLNVGNIRLNTETEAFGDDDIYIEIQMYLMGA
ncbi:hypothetical protein LCGC14_2324370 [marine sediment metagenome]|uniref:Uncharacterized protein n=1 Tax=marine sediment metagenome TaxID=412755 RepID=A0A0F9D4F7_9ZZZZ|nr:hypothetical protein [Pricia sp.]